MSASESTGFAGGGGASKSLCGIREDRALLLELAARVEAGEGCDRELDGDIATLLNPEQHKPEYVRGQARPYTSNLHAAVLLLGHELPEWFWRVGHGSHAGPWAHLNRIHPDNCLPEDEATSYAKTAPRALLAATLKALAGTLADATPNPNTPSTVKELPRG